MPFNLGPGELLLILAIALVVLGPKKLPEVGRSLGKGMREFKDSISGKDDDEAVHHRLAAELPPAEEPPVAPQPHAREREVS